MQPLFYRALAIVSPLVILVVLALPGGTIEALLRPLAAFFHEQSLAPSEMGNMDKVVHACLFLGCAFFEVRAGFFRHLHWSWLFALLLAFAALTEIIQMAIPDRACSVYDLLADTLGISLGITLAYITPPKHATI